MGTEISKQYLEVAGKPVLQHTLERLLRVPRVSAVMVALAVGDDRWSDLACASDPRVLTTHGGKERSESVYNALHALASLAAPDDWILVHDAARPCIMPQDIERLMDALQNDPIGGILALPISDTLKDVENDVIRKTLDRRRVWRALTPQMFRYRTLRTALEWAASEHREVTDEAGAVELLGFQPKIIEGRPDNIKVTRPEDLPLAAFYLEQQCCE